VSSASSSSPRVKTRIECAGAAGPRAASSARRLHQNSSCVGSSEAKALQEQPQQGLVLGKRIRVGEEEGNSCNATTNPSRIEEVAGPCFRHLQLVTVQAAPHCTATWHITGLHYKGRVLTRRPPRR